MVSPNPNQNKHFITMPWLYVCFHSAGSNLRVLSVYMESLLCWVYHISVYLAKFSLFFQISQRDVFLCVCVCVYIWVMLQTNVGCCTLKDAINITMYQSSSLIAKRNISLIYFLNHMELFAKRRGVSCFTGEFCWWYMMISGWYMMISGWNTYELLCCVVRTQRLFDSIERSGLTFTNDPIEPETLW